MIVLIDGLGTSGKATLRGLLDGHPDFFVTPNHDMIVDCLCDFENEKWLKYRDILQLRTMLSNTYYYQLEFYMYRRYMDYDLSVKDRCEFPFELDFYNFDKTWMEKLSKEKKWTPQIIAIHIFSSMMDAWRHYPYCKSSVKHFVSMGFDRPNTAENFLKYFPDGKMLYLVRSIDAIIATRSNRRPVDDDMRSMCLLDTTPEKLVMADHVKKLSEKRRKIERMASIYPNRIKIVDFNELIINTEIVMKDIATFLEVPFNESMLKCTIYGKEMITENGKKYIGEILDKPEELLSDFQRAIIENDLNPINILQNRNNRKIKVIKFFVLNVIRRYWKSFRFSIAKHILPEVKFTEKWVRDGFF